MSDASDIEHDSVFGVHGTVAVGLPGPGGAGSGRGVNGGGIRMMGRGREGKGEGGEVFAWGGQGWSSLPPRRQGSSFPTI